MRRTARVFTRLGFRTKALPALLGVGVCLWVFVFAHRGVLSQDTPMLPPDSSVAASAEGEPAPAAVDTVHADSGSVSTDTAACINVNTHGTERLMELPGIGPVIAERIIAFRTRNGPFSEPADLKKVKGIGPAKVEKAKEFICF